MWQRSTLKANAKIALKGTYWTAFAVTLVAMLIGSAYSVLTFGLQFTPASVVVPFGSILFSIFVVLPISIGTVRYFLRNHFGAAQFETMFSGFQQGYMNGVGAMLVTDVFIGLWSLLFIVPGIIKALQYCFVPFILADNPDIPGSRAREISRMMTNGEKGNIFVFFLSFIGWFLLGALCLGVGILFVYPYFYASFAELYIFLRDRAIANNMLNPAELNLASPEPAPVDQAAEG
jgi:uncharacterized membrane protein